MKQINGKKKHYMKLLLSLFLPLFFILPISVHGEEENEVLLLYNKEEGTEQEYNTTSVQKGTFSSEFSVRADIAYPESEKITVDIEYGEISFLEYEVVNGQQVQQGDIIAKIKVEINEIELEALNLRIQRLQERYEKAQADWEITKEELIDGLRFYYNEKEHKIAELEIEQKEADFFEEQKENQESQQELRKEVQLMEESAEITSIKASCDGKIVFLETFSKGQSLNKEMELAEIASLDKILLEVNNDSGIFTFGKEVLVKNTSDNEELIFEGKVVSASPESVTGELKSQNAYIEISKEDMEQAISNHFVISGYSKKIENVLLVSKKAVQLVNGIGYVEVLQDDGSITTMSFMPGGNNDAYYWIVRGLEEGMNVIVE